MRSLIFTLATLCISGMALAQVAIKAGTVLSYKVNEYDGAGGPNCYHKYTKP